MVGSVGLGPLNSYHVREMRPVEPAVAKQSKSCLRRIEDLKRQVQAHGARSDRTRKAQGRLNNQIAEMCSFQAGSPRSGIGSPRSGIGSPKSAVASAPVGSVNQTFWPPSPRPLPICTTVSSRSTTASSASGTGSYLNSTPPSPVSRARSVSSAAPSPPESPRSSFGGESARGSLRSLGPGRSLRALRVNLQGATNSSPCLGSAAAAADFEQEQRMWRWLPVGAEAKMDASTVDQLAPGAAEEHKPAVVEAVAVPEAKLRPRRFSDEGLVTFHPSGELHSPRCGAKHMEHEFLKAMGHASVRALGASAEGSTSTEGITFADRCKMQLELRQHDK